MRRSRVLYFHEEINGGKLCQLEALHKEYKRYLQACIDTMITARRASVPLGELASFFPAEETLSTNIVLCVRHHAVEIVSGWFTSNYVTKIKPRIYRLFKEGTVSEAQRIQLFTIGKYSVLKPTEKIPQEALDLYWSILLDPEIAGRTPVVSNRIGMRTNKNTSSLKTLEDIELTQWWLGLATLTKYHTIQIPLKSNPHLESPDEVTHGYLVRKDRKGRWRVEVVEKKLVLVPKVTSDAPRIGIDVGLNVIAATSTGRLYGSEFKPKFDKLYNKVKDVRANRQRQGFKENSPRLNSLEGQLSGMIKTCTGTVANQLVKEYPYVIFVHEDLDLRGCRGQKRYAYIELIHSLMYKVPTIAVNPAYTSQECPSCGYASRLNRSGTKFVCRSCGKKAHADVVGGKNVLGRSEDKDIRLDDDPARVKEILRRRFAEKRRSPVGTLEGNELSACSRRLTTKGSPGGIRTASNAEGNSQSDRLLADHS